MQSGLFSALVRLSLVFGALCAALFHLGLNAAMAATRTVADALAFSAWLTATAAAGYFAAGLLALAWGWFRRWPAARRLRLAAGLDAFLLLSWNGGVVFIVASRPFWLGNPAHLLGLAAIGLAAVALAWWLARSRLAGLAGQGRWPLFAAVVFFLLPAVPVGLEPAPAAGVSPAEVQPDRRPGQRLMLIGFDGCTWDVLDPLLAQGALPNFARMIAEGASGTLLSEPAVNQPFANSASQGMRTPVIWETITTGASPREHGVWDFFSTRLAGLAHPLPLRLPVPARLGITREKPVYSLDSREPSVWEIYQDFGLTSLVVGWVHSWPAFEVGGCTLVSDRCHYDSKLLTWPADLARDIAWYDQDFPRIARERLGAGFDPAFYLHADPDSRDYQEQAALKARIAAEKEDWLLRGRYRETAADVLGFDLDPDYAQKWTPAQPEYWAQHLVHNEAADLARDRFYADVAVGRLARLRDAGTALPDLVACYFPSTDTVQHWFWKYYEPAAFREVDPGLARRLGGVIPSVYRNADQILGRLLEYAGEQTTVIVVSDHGGGAWKELESGWGLFAGGGFHEGYSGNHRVNGVLLARGPGIRAGERIPDVSIYDVAPLLLHCSGLPVEEQMPGAVPGALFRPDWLEEHPVRSVSSYGPRRLPPEILELLSAGAGGDAEYMERLKELGYVE